MSITPPAQKIWWREPMDRIEATWVLLALSWCLILFLWMPYWHLYGKQNLSNESYKTDTAKFQAKAEAFAAKHKVGEEEGIPVVAPPANSDVYVMGSTFQWYPILKLKKGTQYKFHISSIDVQHGFSIQPVNINMQISPGYESVVKVTPTETGTFGIVCNEYCGLGHHTMLGKIVVE